LAAWKIQIGLYGTTDWLKYSFLAALLDPVPPRSADHFFTLEECLAPGLGEVGDSSWPRSKPTIRSSR
jgi:hypothetical protein